MPEPMNNCENAVITDADITLDDYGVHFRISCIGNGCGFNFGSDYVIGKIYDFDKIEVGTKGTALMLRIMELLEAQKFSDLKGKYLRFTYTNDWKVDKIGHIIKDKWLSKDDFDFIYKREDE